MIADKPRDVVLPLVEVSAKNGELRFERFHGTCFLVGSRGFALTNRHVLGHDSGNELCALTISNDGSWTAHRVLATEEHPTEDVALLALEDVEIESFLRVTRDPHYQSADYMQWCYPEEVVTELNDGNQVIHRPDLVYLQGYVRRRLSNFDILSLTGVNFFELSEAGSLGCSGSPIILRQASDKWDVIGVFVGERRTQTGDHQSVVGYCARNDAIAEWAPVLLGNALADE